MAAFDYQSLALVAQELINEFGRVVTLSKRDTTPADSSMPWLGPASPGTNTTVDLPGVVTPSADEDMPGTVIKRGDAYAIVSAIDAGQDQDLGQYDTIIDSDSSVWHILNASGINPGPVNLVWILHIKR